MSSMAPADGQHEPEKNLCTEEDASCPTEDRGGCATTQRNPAGIFWVPHKLGVAHCWCCNREESIFPSRLLRRMLKRPETQHNMLINPTQYVLHATHHGEQCRIQGARSYMLQRRQGLAPAKWQGEGQEMYRACVL